MSEIVVKSAEFVRSYVAVDTLDELKNTRIVFTGRSNVGKSSLLNFLAHRTRLARVSNTPGRTQEINLFDVCMLNKESDAQESMTDWLDLPGFGYAKLSKGVQGALSRLLQSFWAETSKDRHTLHLFDMRREPTEEDLTLSNYLRNVSESYVLVLTKADAFPVSKRTPRILQLAKLFDLPKPQVIATSITEQMGRQEILNFIWEATENS